jgi:hypothetical protein
MVIKSQQGSEPSLSGLVGSCRETGMGGEIYRLAGAFCTTDLIFKSHMGLNSTGPTTNTLESRVIAELSKPDSYDSFCELEKQDQISLIKKRLESETNLDEWQLDYAVGRVFEGIRLKHGYKKKAAPAYSRHINGWRLIVNMLVSLPFSAVLIALLGEVGIRGAVIWFFIIFGDAYITGHFLERARYKMAGTTMVGDKEGLNQERIIVGVLLTGLGLIVAYLIVVFLLLVFLGD